MKKSELIEILQQIDGDPEVVMSKDGEGNEYSPCAGYGTAMYDAETTWYGNVYNIEVDETPETAVPCVILWPTN